MPNLNCQFFRLLSRLSRNVKGWNFRLTRIQLSKDRPNLVVLGSGWAAYHLIRQIDPSKYRVTVISPRPYFVFTPLLPSALGGTLSLRSVVSPIARCLLWGGKPAMEYIQARAHSVEPNSNEVICEQSGKSFTVPYHKLAIAVGSDSNTFNIPGAKEHAMFLKDVEDVARIRETLLNNWAKAALPGTSEDEKRKLMKIVVVGGGPAGTEAAAEINDLVTRELKNHYPQLCHIAEVTIIEMLSGLIPMFGPSISQYAVERFKKQGINTLLEHRVIKVDDDTVYTVDKQGINVNIPYSQLIWASGIGQNQICRDLVKKIKEQGNSNVLRIHPNLQLIGSKNIYALGDCARMTPPSLSEASEEFYAQAAKSKYKAPSSWLIANRRKLIAKDFVQLHKRQWRPLSNILKQSMSECEFKELLRGIDKNYIPPVPTAQMAKQAGAWLGQELNNQRSRIRLAAYHPFTPTNYGAMSYVGGGDAVLQFYLSQSTPKPKSFLKLGGFGSQTMWQGYYWLSQTGCYNRVQSAIDIIYSIIAGRDVIQTLGPKQ